MDKWPYPSGIMVPEMTAGDNKRGLSVHDKQKMKILESLEIMDLEETVCVHMDNAFSMKSLNIPTSPIAQQDDVNKWPYLSGIIVPEMTAGGKVSLLIGVDVPEP